MRKENEEFDKSMDCDKEKTIHQLLEVQAQITITPLIRHGKPKVTCFDSDIKQDCEQDCSWDELCSFRRRRCDKNTFTLRQLICVEIPFSIDVDVDVDQGISCCCRPEFGPCRHNHKTQKI